MSFEPSRDWILKLIDVYTATLFSSTLLSGVVIALALYYLLTHFSRDNWKVRTLVLSYLALGIFDDAALYLTALPLFRGVPPAIWVVPLSLAVKGVMAAIVQTFFALRCYHCYHGSVFARVTLAGLAALIIGTLTCNLIGVYNIWTGRPIILVLSLFAGLGTAADLWMTVLLVIFLLRSRDAAHERRGQRLISRVLLLTMETMTPPMICQVLTLALFLALPDVQYHEITGSMQSKLYGISMLIVLDMRTRLREDLEGANHARAVEALSPLHNLTTSSEDEKSLSTKVATTSSGTSSTPLVAF